MKVRIIEKVIRSCCPLRGGSHRKDDQRDGNSYQFGFMKTMDHWIAFRTPTQHLNEKHCLCHRLQKELTSSRPASCADKATPYSSESPCSSMGTSSFLSAHQMDF